MNLSHGSEFTHMPRISTALFPSLTGAQKMRILEQKERAIRVAQEAAYRATIKQASAVPVPEQFIQWAKNARTRHSIIGQLLSYIDVGSLRGLHRETRDGLGRMLNEVWDYCDARCPEDRPVANITEHGASPRDYLAVVIGNATRAG